MDDDDQNVRSDETVGAVPVSEAGERSSRTRGVYYHKHMPQFYGGSTPAAYGGAAPAMYYGNNPAYGAPYGGAGGGGIGDDEDSLMGAVTIGRMIRVCSQRWVTILVFAVIGFVVSTVVYKTLPVIYQAVSVFEMSIRPPRYTRGSDAILNDQSASGNLEEVFNTRLARLRSREIMEGIVRRYRTDNATSTVSDNDLIETLVSSTMTLQRKSRLIQIAIKSTDKRLASDLANAYALAAESFSYDQNKADSESAVAWLKTQAESHARALVERDNALLNYRNENGLDVLDATREANKAALTSVNSDIIALQSQSSRDLELLKTLEAIQNEPEKFSSLPDSVPRSGEIGASFEKLQEADIALKSMLTRLTANHPDVKVKEKEREIYKEQFSDALNRARETAAANLALRKSQIQPLEDRRNVLMDELSKADRTIIACKMRIEQLERAREVESVQYQSLLQRIGEAQLAIDENTTTIRLVEKASEPNAPVSPNPMVIFPAGPILGLLLGILFVLVLDHLEDKIVGIPDIEQRLRLKTLCVLPHVRRKKREQLALIANDDKFSQFAEALAGLRNLLDSPRYHDLTRVVLCMSTQPGEGKTITSTNLAVACAQSGQRTLLIDFDLRRPRLARIFGKSSKEYVSLAHALGNNDPSVFEKLPTKTDVPNLDVVFSKASSEISPSTLMGTGIISEFFDWARKNYDRVVIDSPPFGIVSDVIVLANLADSVMMMCCPDRTRFRPIKYAVRHLTEAGARVIGVVVNDVDFGRRSTFSHYDYHYRYAYKYASQYGAYGYSRGAIKRQESEERAAAAAGGKGDDDDQAAPGRSFARGEVVDAALLADDEE